jgi:transcriptional regulator with XRE-family HTH domain
MGVDRGYVSGLEQGQRNPTVLTLWHASQALAVEVHRLLKEGAC